MQPLSRRNFISRTLLGSAGVLAAQSTLLGKSAQDKFVYKPRMVVNPFINNLRVVCGANKAMITGAPASWSTEGQNAIIDANQVELTIDRMAITLAEKNTAEDSWKTIFRKPDEKEWATVKAAIKVNCFDKNHPRVAIVNKVCIELNRLGVPFEHIVIYDGCSNAQPVYGPFIGKGLPTGVVVSDKNKALGGTMKTPVPDKTGSSHDCTRFIADGTIDILVNIAVNKGADENFGKTTMTLKNHAGTFEPRHIHFGGGLDYILAFNKSNALWGGAVVRQQLCIVDSLWGLTGGPWGVPDKKLDCVIMGTFSGAVDYLTVKKIREPLIGVGHGKVERFLQDFGYAESEIGDLVQVSL